MSYSKKAKVNISIKNAPDRFVEPFIVVRLVNNEFWYYGQYNAERAVMVATELGDNAIILEVDEE